MSSQLPPCRPVDLGSRCTVFMNSRVKQVQKEGATLPDISAGLALSIVKNALFKVVRLRNTAELGDNVIVQGGTFFNESVLRAFEVVIGREVVRPDIAGLMGAFGMALLVRDDYIMRRKKRKERFEADIVEQQDISPSSNTFHDPEHSFLLSLQSLSTFSSSVSTRRCGKCGNNCLLTVNKFSDGREHISGNRFKNERLFSNKFYKPLTPQEALRGTIGIPRVLNMFDEYPFWFTLLTKLKFRVVISAQSSPVMYKKGADTIASDTICYPAKLIHGHVLDLIERLGCKRVFYPAVLFTKTGDDEYQENKDDENEKVGKQENIKKLKNKQKKDKKKKQNKQKKHQTDKNKDNKMDSYSDSFEDSLEDLEDKLPSSSVNQNNKSTNCAHCPIVGTYPEILARNMEIPKVRVKFGGKGRRVLQFIEQYNENVNAENERIEQLGRPYHVDPEISHGMADLLIQLGCAVLTEDSLCNVGGRLYLQRPLRVLDPVYFHTRLYQSASFVSKYEGIKVIDGIEINIFDKKKDQEKENEQQQRDISNSIHRKYKSNRNIHKNRLHYIQLVSFGCGQDAVTSDQVSDILLANNKPYTQIKIDEISNLGAARIRVRSLLAAIKEKEMKEQKDLKETNKDLQGQQKEIKEQVEIQQDIIMNEKELELNGKKKEKEKSKQQSAVTTSAVSQSLISFMPYSSQIPQSQSSSS
ncbi:MAG: putative 2-hydroxyglutaryl-CoA dehydratase [Streblomastix strix]|uniref:N-acetyl-D-glucosamine kinase n=1 Tax=Streblomastix strix TaxID=222440 RepID=A0A5J4WIK5_9EUKA|nr:MAG: putative 2-hydroxyglutaryl-CoA dehydratase [Streblomastix strix]